MLQTVECYRSHLPYPHKITPAYKNSSTVFQKTKKSSFQTETPKNFVELFWILLFLIRKGGSQIAAWRDGERRIEGKRERERGERARSIQRQPKKQDAHLEILEIH